MTRQITAAVARERAVEAHDRMVALILHGDSAAARAERISFDHFTNLARVLERKRDRWADQYEEQKAYRASHPDEEWDQE